MVAFCSLLLVMTVGVYPDDIPIVETGSKELNQNLRSVSQALSDIQPGRLNVVSSALAKNDADEMQQAIDQHVAFVVTINPESRVKVQRGPASINAERGWQHGILVKVIHEGGITASLQVKLKGPAGISCRFFEYQSHADKALALQSKLSGQSVEYQVLILRSNDVGKREVTFSFDAGQATQDLGFRAEVPCLIQTQAGNQPFYFDKTKLLNCLTKEGQEVLCSDVRQWELHRRSHILSNVQQVTGVAPFKAGIYEPVAMRVEEEKEYQGVTLRRISYLVDKTDWVPAIVLLPKKKPNKLPAVLCLHQTTSIGKGEPVGLGGKPNLHYALELAQRGYVTLSPDYPRFGDYKKVEPYTLGYASATMKGISNHRSAVTVLAGMVEVDAERIGCMGHSLGGHNTLFVGLFDERIKALATSCGFCSFPKYYGGNLKGWSHQGYMPRIASVYQSDPKQMPFDFTEVLGALAPRPVFINAPLKDDNFSADGVRDCVSAALPVYQLYGKPKNLVAEYPDCGHDFPMEVRQRCYEFFDRHLQGK